MFTTRDELREHQRKDKLHIGKVFLCLEEGCYGAFTTKKGLDYHLHTHTTKAFNCDACGQVFDSCEFFSAHKKQKSTRKMPNKQNVRVVSTSFMASMRQNATLTLVVISNQKET